MREVQIYEAREIRVEYEGYIMKDNYRHNYKYEGGIMEK